jgi:lysophospholipase L1-like esterase
MTGALKNCYRTESGYPSFAEEQLGQDEFESAACSGAGMYSLGAEMPLYPDGEAPPQFHSLRGNETIVSVTIGDNDAGFGEVTRNCLKAKSPTDTPCRAKYVTSDENKLTSAAEGLSKALGQELDTIRERSPKAKIFLVGYAPIVPKDGAGCWGKIDISTSDASLFYGWQNSIAETEKAVANAHGAVYVDLFHAGVGHDACQPAAKRWTNPVKNVGAAGWPLHPTIAGSKAAAAMLVEAWKRSNARS